MSLAAGPVAVVTGASRGIGKATAEQFEARGYRVVGVARSLVATRTPTRINLPADLTDPEAVRQVAEEVERTVGTPEIVVNNAGSFLLAPFEATTPEDFAAQISANLMAPFLVMRAFLPGMRKRGRGRLVTIGSVADYRAFPGNAAYAAAKTGLRGLISALREELRGSGVSVSLVSPGPTDTAAWDAVNLETTPGLLSRSAMLRAEAVAEAIVWVATRPAGVDVEELRIGPGATAS